MIPSHLPVIVALLGLAACAGITPARMAMPAAIGADVAVTPIVGITPGRSGAFSVGPHSGNYHRGADRLALFDTLLVRNTGHVDFHLDGPDQPRSIDTSCRFSAASSGAGVISVDHSPLRLECRFSSEGKRLAHHLVLNETRTGVADALMRRSRQGRLVWGDQLVTITSVHRLEGSPFETGTPMGYSFAVGDRTIGAVSLANRPTLHIAQAVSDSDRQAVVTAAVALALFWDPVDTQPADG